MTISNLPPVSLIVAMAKNRVIGVENDLPWHLPEDLRRFKALTIGKPVIMGRKTFQSIVARLKRPLPDRPNVVISYNGYSYPGVDVFTDLETAITEMRHEHPDKELMIIGGASIYEQAIDIVDRMYLTLIDTHVRGDAWFPEWKPEDWHELERQSFTGVLPYEFVTLERKREPVTQ